MKKVYLYAAVTIVLWSTIATVSKLLLNTLDSTSVLAISSLFAFLVLFAIVILTPRRALFKQYRLKDYLLMSLLGLSGIFFYNFFYYLGASLLPASKAFTVNYLWPIMSIVFACIILKEKMTIRKAVAVCISFIGVIIIAGGSAKGGSLVGILLCVAAAVNYGLFTALAQKWKYDKVFYMMVSFALTFVICLILQKGSFPTLSFIQLAGLAYNGIFVLAIATILWTIALDVGSTAKISNLAYITPFLSLIWTFLILHEPIQLRSVIGLCVIVLGIFVQIKDKKLPTRAE